MNVVDSSGWLEYFADGPNAQQFARPIQATNTLVVPSVSLFEVFKRVMTQRGEDAALEAIALMRQGRVVPLDDSLALDAARLSVEHRLPMADSIILATALAHQATLWTQDADFEHVRGVRYLPKPRPST
jgi:predicted nucleic acid-binding protein